MDVDEHDLRPTVHESVGDITEIREQICGVENFIANHYISKLLMGVQ